MNKRRLLMLVPAVVLLAACATQSTAPASVASEIGRDPELSTLNKLVTQAGLADTLRMQGPYTFFAPTNDAFNAMPAKTMEELAKDPARLKEVLSYHVVPAKLAAADVKSGKVKTLQGASLELARAGDYVTAGDALVQSADLAASNGTVHKIDRVLMPPKSH